ncbi:MAG TPA: hypothetical protein VI322_01450 [Candidatus Saccharimonadia bacterium]
MSRNCPFAPDGETGTEPVGPPDTDGYSRDGMPDPDGPYGGIESDARPF